MPTPTTEAKTMNGEVNVGEVMERAEDILRTYGYSETADNLRASRAAVSELVAADVEYSEAQDEQDASASYDVDGASVPRAVYERMAAASAVATPAEVTDESSSESKLSELLWLMKHRAMVAHWLVNELRVAHPDIPEVQDDGVLHEAIHDILRVETPTACPQACAHVASPSAGAVVPEGWLNALDAAVSAIYFDDSSKYLRALWTVVRSLKPDIADRLESYAPGAYDEVQAMLAAAPEVKS